MNKQLTISEVQQALCPYIKSECLWCYSYPGEDGNILWIEPKPSHSSTIISWLGRPDWIKPVLSSLSDITDEHALEVAKVFGGIDHLSDESKIAQVKELICTNQLYTKQTNITGSRWLYVFQHLIKKGYAVPLQIDIDHWTNGMTAIELEIAFDKNKTTMQHWIPVEEKLPETEGYYKVKFDDGTEDEKPFRIRPKQNIHGFMTMDNVTHWAPMEWAHEY